jgi:DNA-binding NarL/FixJ family response regulator
VGSYLSGVLLGQAQGRGYSDPVAIVSDRQLSVVALAVLLLRGGRWVVVQRARGGQDVAAMLRSSQVDVVIAEGTWKQLPDEIRSTTAALILIVDPQADPATLGRLFKSDAVGLISHGATSETLRVALNVVKSGGRYVDPALDGCINEAARQADESAGAPRLSKRERLIITELANGKGSREIAIELSVTVKTVGNHVSNAYRKLHLSSRVELVRYVFDQGVGTTPRR